MEEHLIEKLKAIYKHFGNDYQRHKLFEEINEYLESYEEEEIADIFVVAAQLYLASPEIRELAEHKINRTLNRIKNGYYKGVVK